MDKADELLKTATDALEELSRMDERQSMANEAMLATRDEERKAWMTKHDKERDDDRIQSAFAIVGALCAVGELRFDLNEPEWYRRFEIAVTTIADTMKAYDIA